MVERIYRQELMKLVQVVESVGNIVVVIMYQQEFVRLVQNVQKGDIELGEIRRFYGFFEYVSIKMEFKEFVDDVNGFIDLSKNSSSSVFIIFIFNSFFKFFIEFLNYLGSVFMLFR